MFRIKILFTGDFAPCRGFQSFVLDKKEQVFSDALPIIESADLSFTNLECPLTTHNQPINKSGPALKVNPYRIAALKPFYVIGLANNHILDYGKKSLGDTLQNCLGEGQVIVGAGFDLDAAQQPFVQEAQGIKIAIIAIAEHEFN